MANQRHRERGRASGTSSQHAAIPDEETWDHQRILGCVATAQHLAATGAPVTTQDSALFLVSTEFRHRRAVLCPRGRRFPTVPLHAPISAHTDSTRGQSVQWVVETAERPFSTITSQPPLDA